jgi:DNA-directed RNA polymerase specialized sigma24 family protein
MNDWPDFRRQLSDLYPRLLLYAEGRIRRLSWPRGKPQAQDFAQQAIEKALSGKRTYDRKKDLFHNLCQIISCDISHEIQSYDNRCSRHFTSEDDTIINMVDCHENPEDIAL